MSLDVVLCIGLGIVLGIVLLWLVLLVILYLLRPRGVPLRELLGIVPDTVRLVRDLIRDRSVPLDVRVALVGLLAWIISPIDLIPEFIPVLGPLDDVVVTVLALRYVRRRLGSAELERRWPGSPAGFTLLTRLVGAD